ncbi:MAG: phage tail tape measure protein [Lachnospiraceae bacterium]|nr:phage tail tape measure protein [Lachnospiraceae bacterium]
MDDSLMESQGNPEIPTGKATESGKQKKSLPDHLSDYSTIIGFLEYLKIIPEEAAKVDAAMTQLSQSSGASASELRAYFEQAADSAQKYGVSISDLIGITVEWSRMGYGLPDAKALAEAATLYSHITGMDISASNEALVSTVQGLRLEASEVTQLLDMLSKAGSDLSLDPAGIGKALQESAASFRAANTELSQSVALTAGADSILHDPSAVADLWNAVEAHIYGTRQELEAAGTETVGMLESTAQLRDLVQELAGFDIMAGSDGTQLKDLYSIIVGIGNEWQDLSATEQGGLLDALAGSQGDALGSVLDNVSMLQNAYESVEKSSGSALKAQEKYEQGIQYSLSRLLASFQEFADTLAGDGLLKGIVDFGNGTVNVLDFITDKLGALGTLGTIGGAIAGAKGAGLT